jgi:HSP20 family protein
VMLTNHYDMKYSDVLKLMDGDYLIVFKSESQIRKLIEGDDNKSNYNIILGIDNPIQGIVKDDFDAILIFAIVNNQLITIDDVTDLRGLMITLNQNEINNFYGQLTLASDVFNMNVKLPMNRDYIACEQYIHDKLMVHFTDQGIGGMRGVIDTSHHMQRDIGPNSVWHDLLFNSPIDHYFKQLFGGNRHDKQQSLMKHMTPKCNVVELSNEYYVECDVPGMNKQSLSITFSNGNLEIEGNREKKKEHVDNEGHVYHSEVSYGNYYRQIYLPKSMNVNSKDLKAKYENGVLCIRVPIPQDQRSQNNRIMIE